MIAITQQGTDPDFMKLLNVGCGDTFHPEWTNMDINPSSPHVMPYDIRKPLPFDDGHFDAVYSSHVLEHLRKQEAKPFLLEMARVLKNHGIMRIVVPDLEAIAKLYIEKLDAVEAGIIDAKPDYDWMLLELLDQMVRESSGGEMKNFLVDRNIPNKSFVKSRMGKWAESYWNPPNRTPSSPESVAPRPGHRASRLRKYNAIRTIIGLLGGNEHRSAFEEGHFRQAGEVHRWMYDRYSLRVLMEEVGMEGVQTCKGDESRIPRFGSYGLDVVDGQVRKPDSLFMEGRKA
jgi:predicted SAM-dependent methyltransferase